MSETYASHRVFHFGSFVLDVDRGALLRDGEEVKLRPKAFDVLRYLVEHRGRVISRDELLDAIWPDVVVTEDAVTQCLIDVRRAIGDTSQRKIRTVTKRGYVFEETVTEQSRPEPGAEPGPASARQPGFGRWAIGVAAFAVVGLVAVWLSMASNRAPATDTAAVAEVTPEPSIAVLPFSVLSDDRTQTYFADGVSEEILNLLARQRGLRVIARTSSFSFRDRNVDVAAIAEQLGVTHVLEGSLRNDGDQIRVNVQLVDAATGEYLWTERFDRALSASNLFAIQGEIASTVSESLKTELSTREHARLRKIPTDSLEALDAYFEGRGKMETRNPGELSEAEALFEKAVELDPDFALGHVALADVYRLRNNYGSLPNSIANERTEAAVEAALAINDQLGEAYAPLGNLLVRRGDLYGAERAFLRGIELSPNYAPLYQWYAELLSLALGRPHDALSYSKMSVALDPRSAIIRRDHARTLADAGRLDEALEQYDLAIAIDPDLAIGYMGKAILLHAHKGEIADAIPLYRQARRFTPTSPWLMHFLSGALLDLGDFDRAAALIDEAMSRAPGHPAAREAHAGLKLLQGDRTGAAESARAVLDEAPGLPGAVRLLRDHHMQEREYEQALELYRLYYGPLLDESSEAVNLAGWSYAGAIDLSYLLMEIGRTDLASRLLGACRDEAERRERLGIGPPDIALVRIHAILGETDAALAALRRAVDDGWRFGWRLSIDHDAALASLRKLPEFESIVTVIRADMEQQRREVAAREAALAVAEP